MTNENEEIFDSIEEADNKETVETNPEPVAADIMEDIIKPQINSKSPQQIEEERGNKEKRDGDILTIKSIEILPPRTKKLQDGILVHVEPKKASTGTLLYPSKLKVKFTEDNLVEYLPGINFFLKDDGSVNSRVSLNRKGQNTVSKLVKLTLLKMASAKGIKINSALKDEKDLATFNAFSKNTSDGDILDFLIGKKVKIKTEEGVYLGRSWFRNDIVEII